MNTFQTIGSALAVTLSLTSCVDNGGGQKIGIITRTSIDKTLGYCPTNEGEIVRGGLNAGTGVQGAPFHFTIEDPKLVDPVLKAMESGEEVEIIYSKELLTWCRSGSQSNFITSIKPAKRPSGEIKTKVDGPVGVYPENKPKVDNNAELLELMKIQQKIMGKLIEQQGITN